MARNRSPREEYKVFSNRLLEAMERAGVTQTRVAEDLGFSKSMMTNYRRAVSMPESSRLYEIAEYLGVDPAWLFGGDVPMLGVGPELQDRLDSVHRALVLLELFELADTELQRSVLLQMVRELIAEILGQ